MGQRLRATFRKQMRAAADERAAAAADLRGAAVAALHALFGSVSDGATRAAARLLLNELAAALGVEPQRQAHQGGGEAAVLARTGRRREQRRVALMRLRSRGAANGGGIDAGCRCDNVEKRASLEEKRPHPQRLAAGGRLAAGDAVFVGKDLGADCDAGARAGVEPNESDSAGEPPQCQRLLQQQQQQQAQQAAAPAAASATA